MRGRLLAPMQWHLAGKSFYLTNELTLRKLDNTHPRPRKKPKKQKTKKAPPTIQSHQVMLGSNDEIFVQQGEVLAYLSNPLFRVSPWEHNRLHKKSQSFLKYIFIVVQLQLSPFFSHYSPLPCPPPASHLHSSPPLSLSSACSWAPDPWNCQCLPPEFAQRSLMWCTRDKDTVHLLVSQGNKRISKLFPFYFSAQTFSPSKRVKFFPDFVDVLGLPYMHVILIMLTQD